MPDDVKTVRRWPTIGGHPALDLCNTRSWRLDPARAVDRVDTTADLTDWYDTVLRRPSSGSPGRRAGVTAASTADLAWMRRLRDATIAVLDAHLGDEPAPGDALDTIGAGRRRALPAARPSARLPLTWTVDAAADRVLAHTLTLTVLDLLERPDLHLLRRCDGAGCGWLFLDHTRNHSRRWCDPADCGNRARVRSYTERQRRAARPGTARAGAGG
jgi:predicted RNA-binding Zn ribbon-like protein